MRLDFTAIFENGALLAPRKGPAAAALSGLALWIFYTFELVGAVQIIQKTSRWRHNEAGLESSKLPNTIGVLTETNVGW